MKKMNIVACSIGTLVVDMKQSHAVHRSSSHCAPNNSFHFYNDIYTESISHRYERSGKWKCEYMFHRMQWYGCKHCKYPLLMEDSIITEIGPGLLIASSSSFRGIYFYDDTPLGELRHYYCPKCTIYLNVPISRAVPLVTRRNDDILTSYLQSIDLEYVCIRRNRIERI